MLVLIDDTLTSFNDAHMMVPFSHQEQLALTNIADLSILSAWELQYESMSQQMDDVYYLQKCFTLLIWNQLTL